MELDLDVAAIANLEEILFEDKAVQTTEDVEELVQISVSLPELLYRIKAYQRYKRCQLDVSNQVEFCHHEEGCESTCARTDPAHFRRSTKGRSGSCAQSEMKPLSVFEKFQKSLSQEPSSVWDRSRANTSSPSLLGLTERISNMEQVLAIQGGNRPKDLLARVAQLELRLLAVEGQSLEYHHPQTGNKSLPSNKA